MTQTKTRKFGQGGVEETVVVEFPLQVPVTFHCDGDCLETTHEGSALLSPNGMAYLHLPNCVGSSYSVEYSVRPTEEGPQIIFHDRQTKIKNS